MAQMSKELMDMTNSIPCCYWATASRDGTPNVGPIGTTSAISADEIAAAGILMSKTLENLAENPKAAVLVTSVPASSSKAGMSAEKYAQVAGAQIKGSVTLLTSGDVHEKMKGLVAKALGVEASQAVNTTLLLKVEEIYSLSGAEPGKRLA